MSIVLAILSKVEFLVGWSDGGVRWWGGFWPNILSLIVLIEIRIRIKTRLWQFEVVWRVTNFGKKEILGPALKRLSEMPFCLTKSVFMYAISCHRFCLQSSVSIHIYCRLHSLQLSLINRSTLSIVRRWLQKKYEKYTIDWFKWQHI